MAGACLLSQSTQAVGMFLTWWHPNSGEAWNVFVLVCLGTLDLTLPRDKTPYLTARYSDMSMARGLLAESWDVSPDMLTYTFNIREGVLSGITRHR